MAQSETLDEGKFHVGMRVAFDYAAQLCQQTPFSDPDRVAFATEFPAVIIKMVVSPAEGIGCLVRFPHNGEVLFARLPYLRQMV